jgi:hypothetical protein
MNSPTPLVIGAHSDDGSEERRARSTHVNSALLANATPKRDTRPRDYSSLFASDTDPLEYWRCIAPIKDWNYPSLDDGHILSAMVAIRSQRSYPNAGKPWLASDVLFLEIAALRGMSLTRIAGFLGREEGEVRDKAKELPALHGEMESPE